MGRDGGMPTSILDALEDLSDAAPAGLECPSCGSGNVAQVLGDNGGVSYVCTACGHSWS
jgi:transposase-like protein